MMETVKIYPSEKESRCLVRNGTQINFENHSGEHEQKLSKFMRARPI